MRNALLVVILVATVACGAYRFPGSEGGTGTVSGHVTAYPCGPVEPIAQKCIQAPATDCLPNTPNGGGGCGVWPIPGLQLVFTNGDTTRTAKTDSAGSYSIDLPAGTWSVSTYNKGIMRIISGPTTLVVTAGSSIVANYVVDTGIRAAA